MDDEKQIRWVGSAYNDLLAFPKDARKEAGFQLGKVQAGLEPDDWKPFDEVGAGTREIRIREASGIYRVMYVAKFAEAVYVLHCFQKKTQSTSKQDKAIAAARFRAAANARKEKNEDRHRNPPCDKTGSEPLPGIGFYTGRGQTSAGCVAQTDQ
jgi:phage-related protein